MITTIKIAMMTTLTLIMTTTTIKELLRQINNNDNNSDIEYDEDSEIMMTKMKIIITTVKLIMVTAAKKDLWPRWNNTDNDSERIMITTVKIIMMTTVKVIMIRMLKLKIRSPVWSNVQENCPWLHAWTLHKITMITIATLIMNTTVK